MFGQVAIDITQGYNQGYGQGYGYQGYQPTPTNYGAYGGNKGYAYGTNPNSGGNMLEDCCAACAAALCCCCLCNLMS